MFHKYFEKKNYLVSCIFRIKARWALGGDASQWGMSDEGKRRERGKTGRRRVEEEPGMF